MPLTKPAISPRDTEKKERELINEFLKQFFTGAPHNDDAGQPVTFPLCEIAFNQTDIHTLDKPLIHWNFVNRTSTEQPADAGMNIRTDTISNVYAQVAAGGTADEQDHLCATVADNLKELLDSKQALLIAAKGIGHCRVVRGPVPMNLPGLRTRLLIVKARLEYVVPRR